MKFGCGLWNVKSKKDIDEINSIKMKLLKRVLEMPTSTPNVAIQYEFGIGDLHLELVLEKLVLAGEVLQLSRS